MHWNTVVNWPDSTPANGVAGSAVDASRSAALHAAAFGALSPGDGPVSADGPVPADAPFADPVLPAARGARELWWRAVAHGGLGYYARAEADLDRVRRLGAVGEWGLAGLSLEASTRASLLRQMGKHSVAAGFDGRALALAAAGGPMMPAARADALTGLAADNLGRADHWSARRLLEACAEELGESGLPAADDPLWRARLRLLWVRAEAAMAAGDADVALASADAARGYAETVPSERHRVKTALIGAAAAAVSGQPALSAARAAEVVEWTGRAGLLPLRWAACMLLVGVAPGDAIAAERDRCEARMRLRGGNPG